MFIYMDMDGIFHIHVYMIYIYICMYICTCGEDFYWLRGFNAESNENAVGEQIR